MSEPAGRRACFPDDTAPPSSAFHEEPPDTLPAPAPEFGLPRLTLEQLQRLGGQLADAIDLGDERDEPLRAWMRIAEGQVHAEIRARAKAA